MLEDGESPDPDAIDQAAQTAGVRLATARIDANRLGDVRTLESAGFRLMDTLVYYGRSLETLPAAPTVSEDTVIRPATPQDAEAVGAIARDAFRGYMGHYHADPRLDNDAATEAYADWATNSLRNLSETNTTVVAQNDRGVTGFLTTKRDFSGLAEIVLNAVRPSEQGTGIYTALLSHSLKQAREHASIRIVVSTQINNYAVQRVWSRFGFFHERSFYTLHKWFD